MVEIQARGLLGELPVVVCDECGRTDELPEGVDALPAGWETVRVSPTSRRVSDVCPDCIADAIARELLGLRCRRASR